MLERHVLMLATVSAIKPLRPDLDRMAADDAFWQRLVKTPDDALDPDQIRMLRALNVPVPDQRSERAPGAPA